MLVSGHILFFFYRFLLVPTIIFFLRFLPRILSEKIHQMSEDRLNFRWPKLPSRPLWIHAASGEIEYAKPLIRALKAKWPQRMILVTYYSTSAKKLILDTPGIDALVPLPWDQRRIVHRFLDHFRPEIFLLARSDVWPEFVHQCRQRKIPVILFSATLATQSSRLGFFASPLTRFGLDQLDLIDCVSEEDAAEIAKIGSRTRCLVSGDTRYDQVSWRLQHPRPVKDLREPGASPEREPGASPNREPGASPLTFVIGSSWPQDESVILPVLAEFIAHGGRVILAPHEIDAARLRGLEKQLAQLNLKSVRYSRCSHWGTDEILLVDEVGPLQELYTWGQVAFVGGSFKSKVHSVMEPLMAGLPTFVGPKHSNNREALHFQNIRLKDVHFSNSSNEKSLFLVTVLNDSDELRRRLMSMLHESPSQWPKVKQEIRQKLSEKVGATKTLMEQIEALSR